jgi:hypothetical protein
VDGDKAESRLGCVNYIPDSKRIGARRLGLAIRVGRWMAIAAAIVFAASHVSATSIVVAFKSDRIIVLADSRAGMTNRNGNTIRDDMCKFVVLGDQYAFAETGREGYTRDNPLDTAPEWNGRTEAIKASRASPDGDLYHVVLTWAIQVANNFQLFYLADEQRVRGLAVQGGLLLEGIFVGKDNTGSLKVYVAKIALDDTLRVREGAPVPIGYAIDPLPPRDEPYSTEGVTQELLDGKTDRAKEAEILWSQKARHIPRGKREFLRLEFLIEQTGKYDGDVHAPINALQVTRESVVWLQNITCKEAGGAAQRGGR